MKKIVLSSLLALGLSTSLMAQSNWGVGVGTKTTTVSDTKIMGIQSLNEIVGDGGQEVYVEGTYRVDQVKVGTRYSNNSSLDENKFELIWQYDLAATDVSSFYLNGGFGIGFQGGKTKTISTNITKPEYVTAHDLSVYQTPATAKIGQSDFITVSLGVGYKYNVTKSLALSAGYEFERKYWDISYEVEGKTSPVDLSGEAQNFHGLKAAVEYKF